MDEKPKNDGNGGVRYELAGLVDRLAANVIDSFLLILPLMIAAFIIQQGGHGIPRELAQFVFFVVPIAYHWFFWTRRDGQTPGKFAFGIRVVKVDGSGMNDVDAVIRAIGYHISGMLFGLGFIWAFFDKNNQTWHDKMARTYVVRSGKQRKMVEI